MKNNKTHKVALSGLLFALAMTLSLIESILVAPLVGLAMPLLGLSFAIIPGVKLGLSNIVVMYALFFMSMPQALTIAVLKAAFVFFTRGALAGLMSLSGGLLSLLVMWLLYKLPKRPTFFILSVCGSLAHNIGQMIAASFVFGSSIALANTPFLILSGLGMGLITSSSLNMLLPALGRMGYHVKK